MIVKLDDQTFKICKIDDVCKMKTGGQCSTCDKCSKMPAITSEQLITIRTELATTLSRVEAQVVQDRQRLNDKIAANEALIVQAIQAGIVIPT